MKTSYHPRNKNDKSLIKRSAVLIVVFLLGFGIYGLSRDFIQTMASPVWKAENFVSRSLGTFTGFFKSRHTLETENRVLHEKIKSLELERSFLSARLSQEEVIYDIMGRTVVSGGTLTTVLSRPPQTPYDLLVVDIGEGEGVYVGDTVSTPEGVLLGTIVEVSSSSSKVRLYSSGGVETAAYLERDNIPVTLVGAGGSNFKIRVSREVSVERGDRVLSSGVLARLIAVVGDINVRPTDSFKEVLVRTPVNMSDIRFVLIYP